MDKNVTFSQNWPRKIENRGIEKSDPIIWDSYILPIYIYIFVCYLQQIHQVTEKLGNEVTYPKNRNLLTRTI